MPRAVLFAITEDDRRTLESASTDDQKVSYVEEVIEERWEPGFVYELDKAWDALHRSLTDGELKWNESTFPLGAAVLGKTPMHSGDAYLIGLTSAEDVGTVAAALTAVTVDDVREGYARIDPEKYVDLGPEDLDYTLEYFSGLPEFWQQAAKAGRSVIFTVSQ